MHTDSHLGLLVENMGRLNFGGGMTDPKGINTPVTLDGQQAPNQWEAWPLTLNYSEVASLAFESVHACDSEGPAFYRGSFVVTGDPADTYLKPQNFTKGVMWVNGFNLGRYWETQGPQHAFFVPAPYLKSGANPVVILELDRGSSDCTVTLAAEPDFSGKPAAQCRGIPAAGDHVVLRKCESQPELQHWELQNVTGGFRLSMNGLCLLVGSAVDPQSGSPSAQVGSCDSSAVLKLNGSQIVEGQHGSCLDVTAHGSEAGEPAEWYSCNPGTNQEWRLRQAAGNTQDVVSLMDGNCLSLCPGTAQDLGDQALSGVTTFV